MTPTQAAIGWVKQGRSPIPIPVGKKAPILFGWQKGLIKTEHDVRSYFDGVEYSSNIGVLLGNLSNGLIDIDLDCQEAIDSAKSLLPCTRTFGRKSAPLSHYLYECKYVVTTKKFQFKGQVLVEIRSNGCQTVTPPSLHPSGELIEYTANTADTPVPINKEALTKSVSKVAASALVAQRWNQCKGSRHELAMALTGGLCRAGWEKTQIEQFMLAILQASHDEEAKDRERAVIDTLANFKSGKSITGWPRVAEILGSDEASKIREWLGVGDQVYLRENLDTVDPVDSLGSATLVVNTLDTIKEEKIEFIIEDTLVCGKLNLVAGDAGTGKSLALINLLSHITTGTPFPVGNRTCQQGDVLLFSAEDDPSDMLKPRFRLAGADLSRVHIVEAVETVNQQGTKTIDVFRLDKYLPTIDSYCQQHKIKALLLDPTVSFFGKVDAHKNADVRGVLEPLIRLANKYRFAVIAIEHPNKDTSKKILHRIAGSIAFGALARVVYFIGPDPNDEDRKIMAMEKTNVMKRQPSLAFTIEDCDGIPKLVWEPKPVEDLCASDLLAPQEKTTRKRDHCKDWLNAYLSGGSRPATQLLLDAEKVGYKEATLKRAKKELHATSEKVGDKWVWRLQQDQGAQEDQHSPLEVADPLPSRISITLKDKLDPVDTVDPLATTEVTI